MDTNRGIGIQPSEIAKIGFIITFAKFLELIKDDLNKIKYLLAAFCYIGVPIILVMIQPDLGTALSFVFISIAMIYICGIDYKYILGGFLACIVIIPIAWQYVLKAYQKNRILIFINPDSDPMGGGYHVLQSKIAVGSGEFLVQDYLRVLMHKIFCLKSIQTLYLLLLGKNWVL